MRVSLVAFLGSWFKWRALSLLLLRHHHHHLHHSEIHRIHFHPFALGMLIRTILPATSNTEFAVYFRMEEEAFFAMSTCWKKLTVFCWMNKRAVLISVLTVWKMFTFYLFFFGVGAARISSGDCHDFFCEHFFTASCIKPHHSLLFFCRSAQNRSFIHFFYALLLIDYGFQV